ncbi:uncharacterized protein LOC111201741 [Brassica napus]|uniref:uncharacterized protein LOC111201741 n=1 Tax=Brassica napus TaxID=3708 RepID=UPI0006AAC76E|nr:uncharacterized protein LOC111201741 [Brassica napus]
MSPELGRYLREADVRKWARSLFPGERYGIRTTNLAESINSVLRIPREYPVIPLLDSIRELLTRWFNERCLVSSKHLDPLTTKVEKKIDRRIVKAKGFQVYKVDNFKSLMKGDIYDCHVDLERRTCTCGNVKTAYAECINPIAVPESEWNVPAEVKIAKVLPPETRKSAGRPIKRSDVLFKNLFDYLVFAKLLRLVVILKLIDLET